MKNYPDHRFGGPETKVVHHDSSLSAFASGLFIGALVTLVLATEDGRKIGKKLLDSLKDAGHNLEPELEKLPQKLARTVDSLRTNLNPLDPIDRLHRNPPPENEPATFTRAGQPLR